jgi:uncharacterized protein YdeI (YjbR/CyaY-like superfamily)
MKVGNKSPNPSIGGRSPAYGLQEPLMSNVSSHTHIQMTAPLFFQSAKAFRKWLSSNADAASELIVGFYKVDSGRPSIAWPESVDEALCFGWIDGVRKRIDDESYQIRFTPRKPTSIWSAINITKFQDLQARGCMTPAGVKAFSHRTDKKSVIYAYEQEATAQLSPQELRTFKRESAAWGYFEDCPPGYKKVLLHWVTTAKKTETRASRLGTLMQACAAGKRLR